jgi:hypothetical protein
MKIPFAAVVLIPVAAASMAQSVDLTDKAARTREQVRAVQRESSSPGTKNIEVIPDPSTSKSGITREAVRAEERASGSLGTKNIEVIPEPSTRTSKATREEVRAQERASGSSGTGNTEVPGRMRQ